MCYRGSHRSDPGRAGLPAPSLSPNLPWKSTYNQSSQAAANTALQVLSDYYTEWLTHSTLLPSSVLSWPPRGNLQAQLRSSRYFSLWHGTRSQSYTELVPDPPDTNPRKTCQCLRSVSPKSPYTTELYTSPDASVPSPCHSCPLLCPSASDSKPQLHQTAPKPLTCCQGFHWLWLLQAGHRLSCNKTKRSKQMIKQWSTKV